MAQPATSMVPSVEPEYDDVVLIRGASWADYQRLLEIRGERAVPRLAYLEGALQLISPSLSHEALKSMIGRLVEAWCFETGVGLTPYGSWTLEEKELERGVEPDECYVLGDEQEPARPDLAIEVDWSPGRIDKLEIYRKLAVREVWIWRRGAIHVHALRGERYEELAASELLAGIDLALLLQFVDVRPMTRAVESYRAALRG